MPTQSSNSQTYKSFIYTQPTITKAILLSLPLLLIIAIIINQKQPQPVPDQNKDLHLTQGNATLTIEPEAPLRLGTPQILNVKINPNQEKISSMEVYITYDPNSIQVESINPGEFFLRGPQDPIEITKTIESGYIHYALGFPLGSQYNSSDPGTTAKINITPLIAGNTNLTIQTTGIPRTLISNNQAQNVLKNEGYEFSFQITP